MSRKFGLFTIFVVMACLVMTVNSSRKYALPIQRGNLAGASDEDKNVGEAAGKELFAKIEPYLLRRKKDVVCPELSKKHDLIVWLKLTKCQQQQYKACCKQVRGSKNSLRFAALKCLKNICDHLHLEIPKPKKEAPKPKKPQFVAKQCAKHLDEGVRCESCKIHFIISLLRAEIKKGHKFLIFSHSLEMLNYIEESLVNAKFKFLRMDGKTAPKVREKRVKMFQKDDGPEIFLLSSKVGSLGLTLTQADRVIVVDPDWNASTDDQSVDRAHRIGQEKPVITYRLITCGTVEETIYRKQIFKSGLLRIATGQEKPMTFFSQEDLEELFHLPSDEKWFSSSRTQKILSYEHEDDDGILKEQMKSFQKHMKRFQKHLNSFGELDCLVGLSRHSSVFTRKADENQTDSEIERGEERSPGEDLQKLTDSELREQIKKGKSLKSRHMRLEAEATRRQMRLQAGNARRDRENKQDSKNKKYQNLKKKK